MKKLTLFLALALCLAALSACDPDPDPIYIVPDPVYEYEYVYLPAPPEEADTDHSRFVKCAYGDRDKLTRNFRSRLEELDRMKVELDEAIKEYNDTADGKVEIGVLYDVREGREGSVRYPTALTLDCAGLDRFARVLCYSDGQWQTFENAEVADDGNSVAMTIDKVMNFAILLRAE